MPSWGSLRSRFVNLAGRRLDENLFFLHIPKCGGTSLRHAIRSNFLTVDLRRDRHLINLDPAASAKVVRMSRGVDYPHDSSSDIALLKHREELLLYFLSLEKTRYVAGHFTFSDIAYQHFGGRFAFVTLLRDPVKRWVSTYFYNRYKSSNHFRVDLGIEEYLESDFGKAQGAEYVKFIGGANDAEDYSSAQAIERTMGNLAKFAVVGVLEDLGDFSRQFNDRFRVKLKIETKNKNPRPEKSQEEVVTPEIKERIREICRPDYTIYQFVLDNYIGKRR